MTDEPHPSDASATSAAHSGTQLVTNHILTIPHPQYTHFLTQIVHLRSPSGQSSFFVHCSHLPPTLARSLLSSSNPSSGSEPASAEDVELEAALAAAGRSSTSTTTTTTHSTSLSTDFALAINPTTTSTSTSIPILTSTTSSSTSSLATSISKRLSAKLSLPHLLLSLSLPPTLTPAPGSFSSQQDSHALLLLEKALRDTLSLTLASSS